MAALGTGVLIRSLLNLPSLGYNADFDAYKVVFGILERGGNVYADTHRYNYGPLWFLILDGLRRIAELFPLTMDAFRMLIAGFLTLVDLAIALLLLRLFNRTTALLFFLNPITVFITGYHGQFDNLAVLVGLIAMVVYSDPRSDTPPSERRRILGLVVLGFSLMVKHILILLPVLLALKVRGAREKAVTIAVPLLVFLMGFIPYLGDGGWSGIVRNVFLYRSRTNVPLLRAIMPWTVVDLLERIDLPLLLAVGQLFFVGAILWLGLYVRRRDPFTTLLLYLVTVVGVSPAMTNQYLAIPSAALAVFPNLFFLAYMVLGGFFLLVQGEGLGLGTLAYTLRIGNGLLGYSILCVLLVLGLMRVLFGDRFSRWGKQRMAAARGWLRDAAKQQFQRG